MKAKDMRSLDIKGLEQKLKELKEMYSKEYVKTKVGSKTEKISSISLIKKDIARVLTLMNEKVREEM